MLLLKPNFEYREDLIVEIKLHKKKCKSRCGVKWVLQSCEFCGKCFNVFEELVKVLGLFKIIIKKL